MSQTLNDDEKKRIVSALVIRRAYSSAIDIDEVVQSVCLSLIEKGSWHDSGLTVAAFCNIAYCEVFNPLRKELNRLKRFFEPADDTTLMDDVCEIDELELSEDAVARIRTVVEVADTLEDGIRSFATLVRAADPNDAEFWERTLSLPGLSTEVKRQESASPKEKNSLRKVRSRFLTRVGAVLGILTLLLVGLVTQSVLARSNLHPAFGCNESPESQTCRTQKVEANSQTCDICTIWKSNRTCCPKEIHLNSQSVGDRTVWLTSQTCNPKDVWLASQTCRHDGSSDHIPAGQIHFYRPERLQAFLETSC